MTSGDFVLGVAQTRGTDTRAAQQLLARLALELGSLPRLEPA